MLHQKRVIFNTLHKNYPLMRTILIALFIIIITAVKAQDDKTPTAVKFPPKGSKVYLQTDNEKEKNSASHLTDRIKNWGYWDVVLTKEEADYFIELVIREKGGGIRGYIIIKTKTGTELARSKNIKAHGDPANGFSAYRGWSIGIGRWLKQPK
jgi:hypothetical protein